MKSARVKVLVVLCLFLGLFAQFAAGQEKYLLSKDLLELLASEISGEEAFEHVINLSGWPKNRTEKEYKETFYEAVYVLDKTKECGLKHTDVEYFPYDMEDWDPISAELWIEEPVKRKLTGLDMVHLCLIQYSKTTDVTAELIDVGEGTSPKDYEGKDVAGKIVLCKGFEDPVNTEAVQKRGALGIISYRSSYPNEYPDMVSWSAYFQPMIQGSGKYTFGFMISPRQGEELKQLLRLHKRVVMRAHVKSQTHPGKLDVVNTIIKGQEKPDEEIMLMAHLFEYYYKQGANDNKSGSAAIMETARVVNKLIHEKTIPPLKRSIRIFWEPEGWGTFAWLAKYPDAPSRLKAVIDMDMVGESHQKCGSVFRVMTTPDSFPHFFNDVMRHFTEYVAAKSGIGERIESKSAVELIAAPSGSRDPFYHQLVHFNPRMYNETWLGVPHILFNCGPDPFYHSSEDRPDKCDPTQLKRAAFLAAASAIYMANLEEGDIPQLSSVVLAAGEKRLANDQKKAFSLLADSDSNNIHQNYKEALNIIHHGLQRERNTLASIGNYLSLPGEKMEQLAHLMKNRDKSAYSSIKNYYAYLCREHGQNPVKPSLTAEEKRLHRYIPRRIVGLEYLVDFMYLEKALKDDAIKQKLTVFKLGRFVPWEALNFADGKRSILEIRNALSAEFNPIEISLQVVQEYLNALEKAGVVKIEKRKQ
jgi:hypothetical protein